MLNPGEEGIMKNRITYCGVDCGTCPAYEATMKDDWFARRELAAQWTTPNYPVMAEEINCFGCQSEGEQIFIFCRECEMRLCGMKREVQTCAECRDYPCQIIERAPVEVKERLEKLRG